MSRLPQSKTLNYESDVVKPDFIHAGRGEDVFEGMLAAQGFIGLHIPEDMLHEEYQEGAYKILRICKV